MQAVRYELTPAIARNKAAAEAEDAFDVRMGDAREARDAPSRKLAEFVDAIIDIREYDVAYHHRFAIDTGAWGLPISDPGCFRILGRLLTRRGAGTLCGHWYEVQKALGRVTL
jgi:hypothetical protein